MTEDQRPPDDPDATIESGESPGDSAPRQRLGDFELLSELGRGGMGIVYEARQLSLKRRVALKVLPPALGMTAQARQRFEREAQAAAKLHHTHIVPVHAIGEHDGHHFYAMELIDGQSLDHVLRDMADEGSNPLMEATVTQTVTELRPQKAATTSQDPATTSLSDTSAGGREWFDTVAKLTADVADALHYAHGRGVVHRDVKPANLMLSKDGHLSITDFGLARLLEEPGMTVSGSFLGTPAYMAPEQIAAGRIQVDHRADIYSLGAVLYELLTMQRPFGGESREQVLAAVMSKDPRPPRRFNGKIPVDLETICLKALEKDPDRRYATAGELAQDLRQYLQGGLIAARRAGPVRRTWKAVRRHPVVATVAIAGLVVIAALVVGWQAGGRAEAVQRLVADARLALREGTYWDGLRLIDRAVEFDPDSVEARLVRARLLLPIDREWETANEARSVLEAEPQNYEAHAILADLALFPAPRHRLASIDPEPHLRVVEAHAPESADAYYLRALGVSEARQRIALLDRVLDMNPSHRRASVAKMLALRGLQDSEVELTETNRLITARPGSAQGWRMKAITLQDRRDFLNARAAIERAMEVDDRDPSNYHVRDGIQRDMGEHDDSLSDLNRAIELDPARANSYLVRASRLNGMGRFEEAIADARKSIELNPDLLGGYRQLGRSYLSLDRKDELRTLIDELRVRADGWFDVESKVEAYLWIADAYRQLKDYDRALESADRAINLDPGTFYSFIVRMTIHKELGNAEGVKSDCEAAARIDLGTPVDFYNRAVSIGGAYCNDRAGALKDYERVIELAPKWHLGYVGRGIARARQGHWEQALADLDRAVELAPLHPWPHAFRANVFEGHGRYKEGLADRKRSVELDPQYASGWRNYGNSLFLLGRSREALVAHEKALELRPNYVKALRDRAYTLAWLGRCEEASTEYREAQELAPVQSSAIIARAHLFAFFYNCPDHYDLTEALRHARSAYEADPARGRLPLASALFRAGDHAEARRLFLELFKENPDSDVWFNLAMCLWRLGEKTEARRFYDRSVSWMEERVPDHPVGVRQRQEAADLLGLQP